MEAQPELILPLQPWEEEIVYSISLKCVLSPVCESLCNVVADISVEQKETKNNPSPPPQENKRW